MHRVLEGSPEPFTTANLEKRAALSRFQPHGVLISDADGRDERRPFNAAVLDEHRPMHQMAERITAKVQQEADALVDHVRWSGRLTWDAFIRDVVARRTSTDARRHRPRRSRTDGHARQPAPRRQLVLPQPRRDDLRQRFEQRLRRHIGRGEPGSLAQLMASVPATEATMPHQQVRSGCSPSLPRAWRPSVRWRC